jgi:hypothetical protein
VKYTNRPAPGLYRRWKTVLRGASLALGVVVLLGGVALVIDQRIRPEQIELESLQKKIKYGDFSGYDLDDLWRRDELREKLKKFQSNDLKTAGDSLLFFGLLSLFTIQVLMWTQELFRWLWKGNRD